MLPTAGVPGSYRIAFANQEVDTGALWQDLILQAYGLRDGLSKAVVRISGMNRSKLHDHDAQS